MLTIVHAQNQRTILGRATAGMAALLSMHEQSLLDKDAHANGCSGLVLEMSLG